MRSRGFTIVEMLIAIAVLALLIFAVCDAVSHTVHLGALDLSRAGAARTSTALETRMSEEARSATSVFVPALDVLGQNNAGTSAHEVDFYRKLPGGSDAYVAYRFDSGAGTVTRYDYTLTGSTPQTTDADISASGILSFVPQAIDVGASGDVVGGSQIVPVSVYYGRAQSAGGNGVVVVSIMSGSAAGAPSRSSVLHLAAKSMPTDFAELVSSSSPPPHTGLHTVTFMVIPKVIKGVWHGGGPDGGWNDIHSVALSGSATFIGDGGDNVNWFDVSSQEPVLESGLYNLHNENGQNFQLSISCLDESCPQFVPLPQNIPGAPKGLVIFKTSQ
ncbi:MAG TPA: prepilin-type N-terminal cleavage/methylation domain-containing protein [Candidatus Eremiobacteraceae bacterium]|nr:prepilin-type N-terminal cleavage/methylation domain-containing protein [Candidatus Eremiobacteraceae bacterium]